MYFPCLSPTVHEQAIDPKQLTVISHACLKDGVKHSDGLSHTCIEDIASIANMPSPPAYVKVSWYHPNILNFFTNLNYCVHIYFGCVHGPFAKCWLITATVWQTSVMYGGYRESDHFQIGMYSRR